VKKDQPLFINSELDASSVRLISEGLNHLSQGIAIFDLELDLVAWNQAAQTLLDFPPNMLKPGTNLAEFFRFNAKRGEYGDGDVETQVAERMALAKLFEPHSFERVRPTGEILEVVGAPLPTGGLVATYTDVTARRRAEALSTANRILFQQTIDAAPMAVTIKDPQQRYVFVNRYAAERHGLQPEEFVGRTTEQVLPSEEDAAFVDGVVSSDILVITRGQPMPFFEEPVTISGTTRLMMTSKTPLFGDDGKVSYLLTVALDISDRKRAEDALGKALREAELANQAKSDFLATISHELRTPLNAISGFSEMLISQFHGPLGSPKYLEYIGDIHASSDHLLLLVNDVLDLSAIEAGKFPIDQVELTIDAIVDDFNAIIAAPVLRKNISLTIDTPDTPRPLTADRRALRQIFLNLLSNAVKYTPHGGKIRFRISQSSDNTSFEISDTGPGIPAQKLPQLTDPFVRVETDPHTTHEGVGLGLAIVKSLVDLHRGKLTITSEVGEGTVVTVSLPAGPVGTGC